MYKYETLKKLIGSSLRVIGAHCRVNGQSPAISLGRFKSLLSWAICFSRRVILPRNSSMAISVLGPSGRRRLGILVSGIKLELNTTFFSRVPYLPHVAMLASPSPEPVYSLQRINLPSSYRVREGQVSGCIGSNCIL